VRNGAIGIVPEKFPVATVTSEFPVYCIKKEVAVSEYIQLVFRTQYFRKIINSMVSGTSGRKRVQTEDLENVEIPLPPLTEQKAIVARWRFGFLVFVWHKFGVVQLATLGIVRTSNTNQQTNKTQT
jgi:type I restriction enzyme S subunit